MDRTFTRKALIAALALGALVVCCYGASAVEPEADASLKGFAAQIGQWQALAQQGNAKGQLMFGMVLLGSGSSPEVKSEGAQWIFKSAEQRYAPALTLMRKLALAGNVGFQMYLGTMYSEGTAVLQDYAEAARWYRLCAEKGDAMCQNELGVMYLRGEGVPQDYVQAHKWFNLAASGSVGDRVEAAMPKASTEVRRLAIRNRALAAANMTSEQIAEAQRLAREWQEQHPSQAHE